jgi:hypothetical protein
MFSSFNFSSFNRDRTGQTAQIQKLLETASTPLEEVLRFPNIVSELQGSVDGKSFFTLQKIENLISFVFDPESIKSMPFEDAKKITFASFELLAGKVNCIGEFFFHSNSEPSASKLKKSGMIIEDGENDFDFDCNGKDLLLSPANSVKSKSTTTVESYNKPLLDYLFSSALRRDSLDDTRAGYLNKIVLTFFQKHKNELLNYIFKSGFEYTLLAKYLDSYAVADLLANILLFENLSGNDSIVFHESHAQIVNDHIKSRAELISSVLSNPAIVSNKDVAGNTRFLLDEFLNKFKNINDSELLFIEIFGTDKVFRFWVDALKQTRQETVEYEIMNMFKSFARFLVGLGAAKGGIVDESLKSLIIEDGILHQKLPGIITEIVNKYLKQEKQPAGSSRELKSWITTNKYVSSAVTKLTLALLEFSLEMLRQKFIPVHLIFCNKAFLEYLLVDSLGRNDRLRPQ